MFVLKCYSFNNFIGYLTRYNKSCILCVTQNLDAAIHFNSIEYFIEEVIPCLPHNNFIYILVDYDSLIDKGV